MTDDETLRSGLPGTTVAGMNATTIWNLGTIAIPALPSPENAGSGAYQQIVFIDGNVAGAKNLAAGVAPGVLAVVLDPAQDGLAQVAAFLERHDVSNLKAIDIVAHGADGLISLGTGVLSKDTLAGYQTDLAAIGAALTPSGAIQIYGCDVAQDEAGSAFLQQLSAATGGVSIAASSHLVGAAAGGGNWDLNVNTGSIDVTSPFTATAEAGFTGELTVTPTNQLFAVFNVNNVDNNTAFGAGIRIEQIGVSGASASGTIDVRDGTQSRNFVQGFNGFDGIAVDAPLGEYFVVNSDNTTANQILVGSVLGGTPRDLYDTPDLPDYQLAGLALDPTNALIYFSVAATTAAAAGIYRISVNGGAATQVVSGSTSAFTAPLDLALDVPDHLVFFTDQNGFGNGEDALYVANTSNGAVTSLTSELGASLSSMINSNGALLHGVAVDAATKSLYFTVLNGSVIADNGIYKATYALSAGTAAITGVTTLYAGANVASVLPGSLTIDTQNNLFYVGSDAAAAVYEGSLANTTPTASLTPVFGLASGDNPQTGGLFLLSKPTITASGTVNYIQAAAPVAVGATPALTNPDGQGLARATVQITGGSATDLLSATTTGTAITASYNAANQTLTLTGADTVANYQTVLDSVKFSASGTNFGIRTIAWTVNDGVSNSTTPVSSVNFVTQPTITAGATAVFTGGGAAVTLDSGLTLTDPSSTTLASATVLVGGFIAGDTLTVATPGGLASSFNNGTLTLTGVASVATYQTALDSIAYSFSPANGDPTNGGGRTSRSISWSVNDGTLSSAVVTSTLNTAHAAGTVAASGSVTYTGTPVALDPSLTVADTDSGGTVASATATIGNFQSGDTLQFNSQNGITGTYASATGVLTLSGTATLANYQAALDSVAFATTSAVQSVRTVAWAFNDGAGPSNTATSSVNVLCFCIGTLIDTPLGEVQVEKLKVGDMVLTAHNGPRPVKWIGIGKVLATRGQRTAATPVIVRKGALGDNLPHHDLHLTKAHGLYVNDVLIPVEFLVNHKTILWDDRAQEVCLYHVELESHDILLANGAPAESYRDDGNRWLFQNANSGWGLTPQRPYAPVVTGGPVVDATWRQLLDRAGPRFLPPMTGDPDLHLMVDGKRVDAAEARGSVYVFQLPCRPRSVHLASREVVPAELGIARDPRSLGVALRRVSVRCGGRFVLLPASDTRLDAGWHEYEAADNVRWTDGYAALPADMFADFASALEIMVQLGGATQYPDCGNNAVRSAA